MINFCRCDSCFSKNAAQMIELVIFIIGFVLGGLTVAATHCLLREEDRTDDSVDTALTSLFRQD